MESCNQNINLNGLCDSSSDHSVIFLILLAQKYKEKKNTSGPYLRKSLLKVTYQMLLKATDGFFSTNLIGVRSFGSVYKGILGKEGSIVVVKALNLQRRGASSQSVKP